jgi:hypothetical protein
MYSHSFIFYQNLPYYFGDEKSTVGYYFILLSHYVENFILSSYNFYPVQCTLVPMRKPDRVKL